MATTKKISPNKEGGVCRVGRWIWRQVIGSIPTRARKEYEALLLIRGTFTFTKLPEVVTVQGLSTPSTLIACKLSQKFCFLFCSPFLFLSPLSQKDTVGK